MTVLMLPSFNDNGDSGGNPRLHNENNPGDSNSCLYKQLLI